MLFLSDDHSAIVRIVYFLSMNNRILQWAYDTSEGEMCYFKKHLNEVI